jgi:hypothetical protein
MKAQEEKPKKGGKSTIASLKPGVQYAGDFTPGVALKLTERQFGIIEENRLRDLEKEEVVQAKEPVLAPTKVQVQEPVQKPVQKPVQAPVQITIPPHLTEKVIFPETTESESVPPTTKYVPKSIMKRETTPAEEPKPVPTDKRSAPMAHIVSEEPKPAPYTHLPYIQGLATEVKPYNTIPETRTEPVEFVTIEQIVYIGSVMYYIPSQCIKMNAAPYIHAQDAEKKVSDNK